jgi:hypothetical protein
VRSLFARKLPSATRNASHNAVTRKNESERFLTERVGSSAAGSGPKFVIIRDMKL